MPASQDAPPPWPVEVNEFRPQASLRAVISGVGSVRDRLAGELQTQGVKRPLIVCGEHVSRSPAVDVVASTLGGTPLVYDGSRPHTPVEAVNRGAAVARDAEADAFIALGGSSAVDCAKGIAVLVSTGTTDVTDLSPLEFGQLAEAAQPPTGRAFPLVSITTTLSFAEFLPFWGARHASIRRKLPYADQGAVLRTIFLDGEMAAYTPAQVWVETGVKALDDAVSAFCRAHRSEPFLDPVLIEAIAALDAWLPRSSETGQADIRQQVLIATWMTKMGLPRLSRPSAPGWFSTSARHALGGIYELPHGVGSCVALGPGLRYHAAATRPRQEQLRRALGWPTAEEGEAPLGPGAARLLGELGVPTTLTQAGVDTGRLDDVVTNILAESPSLGSREQIGAVCSQMV
ncbi:MAG TPA: iron-containing alcohol dehydrogenase [Acidimicrobiales bacterium]|nr:iron-containing alcohol dehydrogenase [Acidimicrobiales bacterium]